MATKPRFDSNRQREIQQKRVESKPAKQRYTKYLALEVLVNADREMATSLATHPNRHVRKAAWRRAIMLGPQS